jgi:DNA-binding Xre family transcriptional regulator
MTKEQASQISKNIKKIIKEKKISKSVLVMKTGLDYHTISKIENGATPDPRINTVIKLVRALEISLDDLIK